MKKLNKGMQAIIAKRKEKEGDTCKGEMPKNKKKSKLEESVSAFIASLVQKDYAGAEKHLQTCVSEKIKSKIVQINTQKRP